MEHKEYRKLHAEWYEYLSDAAPDLNQEIDFWAKCVKEAGEPVLELGSGTGKILIPLLEKGVDITGIDTSEDMMARCRARCQARNLNPQLFEQSMLDFHLQRQFSLVILPSGSLGLFTSGDDIHSMFGRVMAHLKPGGRFIYGFEHLPKESATNNQWTGNWVHGPGDILLAWRRHWRYDKATHIWECLFVVEKFVAGRLVETEANERRGRFFSIEEAVEYARAGGFKDIRVTDGFSEEPATECSDSVVVRCRRAD